MRAADGRARVRVRWRLYQIFLNRLACSAADDGDDKTTILHLQHTFLGSFLCHHWTTTTWKYLISRFMEDVNKRRRNSPFSFWSRMLFLRIELQKRVLLHLIKVTASWNERDFSFFKQRISPPSPSWYLKLPSTGSLRDRSRSLNEKYFYCTREKISFRRGLLFGILRTCLHGREEPQLISHMVTTTIKQDQIKMRDYIKRKNRLKPVA